MRPYLVSHWRLAGLVVVASSLLVAACTTTTPTPVSSLSAGPTPAPSMVGAINVFCDGFPPSSSPLSLRSPCTGLAAEAIDLLPSPHPVVLAVRLVYTAPVTQHPMGATIAAGFTFQGEPHVVGHLFVVEGGTLVPAGR